MISTKEDPIEQKEDDYAMEEVERLQKILKNANSSVGNKEAALVELAHLGLREANTVIETFISELEEDENEGLKFWAEIALDEGTFMASGPEDAEDTERLLKEAVYQSYTEYIFDLEDKLWDVENDIAELEYEQEIAERLKEKAETEEEKERWQLQEDVFHDLLIWNENRKETLENDLEIDNAMAAEIFSDLMEVEKAGK